MKIKKLDNNVNRRIFGLVAGQPGVGKTTQATTFPKKETLIVSVENGLLSIAGSEFAAIEAQSYDEVLDIVSNPPSWVKYLYIDSLSEIYDMLKKELSEKFTRAQNFAKFEEMNLKLLYLVRMAKRLDIDVYFTCHVKMVSEMGGKDYELSFDGKMPNDLKKQFDFVLQLAFDDDDEGGTKRVFITSPEHSMIAKARVSPWLGIEIKEIEEDNLYKLTNKLKGVKHG